MKGNNLEIKDQNNSNLHSNKEKTNKYDNFKLYGKRCFK